MARHSAFERATLGIVLEALDVSAVFLLMFHNRLYARQKDGPFHKGQALLWTATDSSFVGIFYDECWL